MNNRGKGLEIFQMEREIPAYIARAVQSCKLQGWVAYARGLEH